MFFSKRQLIFYQKVKHFYIATILYKFILSYRYKLIFIFNKKNLFNLLNNLFKNDNKTFKILIDNVYNIIVFLERRKKYQNEVN